MEEDDKGREDKGNKLITQEQSESDENDKSCMNLCGLVSCISRQKKTKRPYSQRETVAVTQSPQNGLFIQISEQFDQDDDVVNIDANAGVCKEARSKSVETSIVTCPQSSAKFFLPRVTSVTGGQKEAEERLLSRAVGRHTAARSRFLTIGRLKRRKPPTRALQNYAALLDDIYNGPTNCALEKVGKWDFNAFVLDSMSGGRPVTLLCTFLLHYYGLLRSFHLDFTSVWKCFSLIEDGYHSSNPYHNAIHAADVTQAMHCYLQESTICSSLTQIELLAALIAAVCHDLDHPGVNQPFLIATDNHLAVLYNNASVLENHHWRCAMGCLWESGILNSWSPEDVAVLQEMIRSLILATDITRQNEFLSSFRKYLETDTLDMSKEECRHFSLQIALKCADICNPCRPWEVCRHWAHKICDEFYRQGDYERQLKLPVTPLCDRHSNTVAKIQAGFIKFVVQPLFESWECWLSTCLSGIMLSNLKKNLSKWEQELLKENESNNHSDDSISSKHSKVKPTVSMLSCSSASSDESGRSVLGSLECMSHTLILKRRHSLPGHASCFVPRTVIRRESLGEAGHPMLVYETVTMGDSPPPSAISPRRAENFFSSQTQEKSGSLRRQSFPLQSPNYLGNQALRFFSPPTPLREENTLSVINPEIITDKEEKEKKSTGTSMGRNVGEIISESSKPRCQTQSANDKEIPIVIQELKANHLSRRSSLESGTKRESSNDSSHFCKKKKEMMEQEYQLETNTLHKNNNKENKPPDRFMWKNKLWKSLNHEDSYCERTPLITKPQPKSFTNRRRGSAPVIRIEELRRSARGSENSSDYLSKRRGSAPNRILCTGNPLPVLTKKIAKENDCLIMRRGSAPTNGLVNEHLTIKYDFAPKNDSVNMRRGSAPENGSINIRRGSAPANEPLYIRYGSVPSKYDRFARRGSAPSNERDSAKANDICVGSSTKQFNIIKSTLRKLDTSGGGSYNDWEANRMHFSHKDHFSPSLQTRRTSFSFELISGVWRCEYELGIPMLLSNDSILLSSGSCTPVTSELLNAAIDRSEEFGFPFVHRRGSLPTDVFSCGETLIFSKESS